jgi:hypothetical protein
MMRLQPGAGVIVSWGPKYSPHDDNFSGTPHRTHQNWLNDQSTLHLGPFSFAYLSSLPQFLLYLILIMSVPQRGTEKLSLLLLAACLCHITNLFSVPFTATHIFICYIEASGWIWREEPLELGLRPRTSVTAATYSFWGNGVNKTPRYGASGIVRTRCSSWYLVTVIS